MLGNLKKVITISLRADKILTKYFPITCSQLKFSDSIIYSEVIEALSLKKMRQFVSVISYLYIIFIVL